MVRLKTGIIEHGLSKTKQQKDIVVTVEEKFNQGPKENPKYGSWYPSQVRKKDIIHCVNIDFLLVNWKLNFVFFLHGLFVLEYADSFN